MASLNSCPVPQRQSAHLLGLGVCTAESWTSIPRVVLIAGWSGCCFASTDSFEPCSADEDVRFSLSAAAAGSAVVAVAAEALTGLSELGESGWSFFSLSLASSPSTLLRRASRTSVLGPLFLGTASEETVVSSDTPRNIVYHAGNWLLWVMRTVYTRTLENLTGFT